LATTFFEQLYNGQRKSFSGGEDRVDKVVDDTKQNWLGFRLFSGSLGFHYPTEDEQYFEDEQNEMKKKEK
jgi:hypothetical protein